jgi:hypothetical protein
MVREYVYIQTLQRWEGCGVTKSITCTIVGRKCKEKANGDAARMGGSLYYLTCSAFVKASYWDRLNLRSRNGQIMAHYVIGVWRGNPGDWWYGLNIVQPAGKRSV